MVGSSDQTLKYIFGLGPAGTMGAQGVRSYDVRGGWKS